MSTDITAPAITAPPLVAKPQGAAALPDSTQVCSCNNVSKGDLCAAIEAGCTSVGALKKATKAGTSCGGCGQLLAQVLKAELARKGFTINNHLCEHFAYSRQQLFHLVRIGELKDFDALLAKHGKGHGCDICKPTVASILASCWNGFVLEARKAAPLQDTNDYFLANMQKDGTYSVVPRVPGGEITPEKLIVIGASGTALRPVHEDHRRPAHRPVRRAGARAAADLARVDRRRLRIGPRLWEGAAHRSSRASGRRGVATACRTVSVSQSRSRTATRACARRTRSRWPCRAVPASVPRRRARTSASSRPRKAGTCLSAATAACGHVTRTSSPATSMTRR